MSGHDSMLAISCEEMIQPVSGKPVEYYGSVPRVAIVLSELRLGGMERVVTHLARNLPGFGVEPVVVCMRNEGQLAAELHAAGIRVVALGSMRGYDLRGLSRLARFFRQFRPTVVNVHDYSSLPYTVLGTLSCPGCPVVFTAHGLLYEGAERLRRRNRLVSHGIRALTAVSEQVRDRHASYLDWRGPSHVVSNGVPGIARKPEIDREVRDELGIEPDEFVFLAAGNPRPEKAFDDLIRAAVLVQRQAGERPFSVLIAGFLLPNDYCRDLQQAARASGVAGLRLLGHRTDIERLYSVADALVIPSRSEGLPMVLLEAMTAGLPIVATRVGGIPKVVSDDWGLLVEPDQPRELAQAMLQMIQAGKPACHVMGQAARDEAVRRYGVKKMVEGYLEVFTSVARGRTGKNPS